MPPRLTFPEPAAGILERTRGILDRHVTPCTPRESGWSIGGGSILAARWNHRWSKDLDVFLHPKTELALLTEARNPELWNALRSVGGRHHGPPDYLCFMFEQGQLEILADDRTPKTAPRTVELECRGTIITAPALGADQILESKLRHRGFGAPVRDLYDIAVAAKLAPRELARAVNARPQRLIRMSTWSWKSQNDEYGRAAKKELRDVPRDHEHISENPGTAAAVAVMGSRYKFLTIEASKGLISARYGHDTLDEQATYRTPTGARKGFENTGLNAALAARGWTPRQLLAEASAVLKNGGSMTVEAVNEPGPPGGNGPDRPHIGRVRR